MSFNQLSAGSLQAVIRKLLSLDAEANQNLHQFDGKVIKIHLEDFNLSYFFSFKDGELSVFESYDGDVTACISGPINAYLAAIAKEHSADSFFKGELNFTGKISAAQQLQEFAQKLKIDWHEPFAQLFGDPIGHSIATGLENITIWLFNTINSVQQDISEYIQEEAKVTPSSSEQQQFFRQVDQIRSQADRLNARIALLKDKHSTTS